MSFDTNIFWILFTIVLLVYQILPASKRPLFLLFVSYAHYATWDYRFTLLLMTSTIVDYWSAVFVARERKEPLRRAVLFASISFNLSLLAFFKYYWSWANLYHIGIPIGISFYTFQSMSYTLDVYRGRLKPYRSFQQVALFVSFFPQVAAGPIERARNLLPQFSHMDSVRFENVKTGTLLILLGLFKKIYVSEGLRVAVESVFASKQAPGSVVVLGCLLLVFQVYTDFSGYSDMARGMARMFNIKLMINFRPFYFATSPSDFWQRWHISLTTWIRDYAILPLKRRAKTAFGYEASILLTFILFGLWHEAKWTWILFGFVHGMAVLSERFMKRTSYFHQIPIWFRAVFGWAFMMVIYFLSGLFHQSASLEQAGHLASQILNSAFFTPETTHLILYAAQFIFPLALYELVQEKTKDYDWIEKRGFVLKVIFVSCCLAGIILLERATKIGFIYFNF